MSSPLRNRENIPKYSPGEHIESYNNSCFRRKFTLWTVQIYTQIALFTVQFCIESALLRVQNWRIVTSSSILISTFAKSIYNNGEITSQF